MFNPVSNESPVSTFETGSRISVFQSRVRDGIENFFLPVSRFETRSRFSFFQSRASRRAREFFLSISCFETSTRIFPPNLRLRDESEKFCHFVSVFETRTGFFSGFHFCITFIFYKDEYTRLSRSWMKVKVVCLGVQPVLSFGHLLGGGARVTGDAAHSSK